jgi:tRNA pseudouridine55 synthase
MADATTRRPDPEAARPADGVLVVDKPEGPTSHDVVARARRALRTRQIGHTGTLDPMATGVLALVVGRATRLAQFLSGREKAYDARIRLGLVTDTWDRTGVVVSQVSPAASLPDAAAVESALRGFVGEHEQLPPPFSAKKIEGVRAYDLARQGRDVPVQAVRVTLHSVRLLSHDGPFVDVAVECSAGFYVRALAHHFGRRLGCGACLESLRRTASGGFRLDQAVSLDAVEQSPLDALARLVPLERALDDLPALVLTEAGLTRALHGNEVEPGNYRPPPSSGDPASAGSSAGAVQLLDPAGHLVAIARPTDRPGVLHPAVVLK